MLQIQYFNFMDSLGVTETVPLSTRLDRKGLGVLLLEEEVAGVKRGVLGLVYCGLCNGWEPC